jgi:hypothetical protein
VFGVPNVACALLSLSLFTSMITGPPEEPPISETCTFHVWPPDVMPTVPLVRK